MNSLQNSLVQTSMPWRLASDSFENDTHSTERAKNNTPTFGITTDDHLSKPTEPHQPATVMQPKFNMNALPSVFPDLLSCFLITFKSTTNTNLNLLSTHGRYSAEDGIGGHLTEGHGTSHVCSRRRKMIRIRSKPSNPLLDPAVQLNLAQRNRYNGDRSNLTTLSSHYKLSVRAQTHVLYHILAAETCTKAVIIFCSMKKCLTPFADRAQHLCANTPIKCAPQSHGNHPSRHSVYPVAENHKYKLKLVADKALTEGSIERKIPRV